MALSLIAFTPRSAAGQDYGLEQADWNGMRDLVDLAESAQIELTLEETLDFDTLDLEEPLLIVYPHQPLRADSLSRYVVEGGRVLLADDFGQSTPLLQRLDVDRLEPLRGTLPHQEFLQQNPALPVFRARGEHALLEGVEVIVANHPAVLFNVGGPVLEYDEDGGLVYDMNLGQGKVIVLGDSSLLINHMLPVADNAALVRNALDYVCRAKRPCRLHAYVGDFEQRGAYGERDEIFGDKEEISVQVEKLNEYVDTLMRELPAAQLFYYLERADRARAGGLPGGDLPAASHSPLQRLRAGHAQRDPRASVGVRLEHRALFAGRQRHELCPPRGDPQGTCRAPGARRLGPLGAHAQPAPHGARDRAAVRRPALERSLC